MRFFVSGPVSSIFCLPTRPQRTSVVSSSVSVAQQCSTPRGRYVLLNSGKSFGLGPVGQLGLFFGVEVIEIAEELVEAVDGGQKLVAVAEVVLAELARRVAVVLQQFGDRRVLGLEPDGRAGHADLRQSRAKAATAR